MRTDVDLADTTAGRWCIGDVRADGLAVPSGVPTCCGCCLCSNVVRLRVWGVPRGVPRVVACGESARVLRLEVCGGVGGPRVEAFGESGGGPCPAACAAAKAARLVAGGEAPMVTRGAANGDLGTVLQETCGEACGVARGPDRAGEVAETRGFSAPFSELAPKTEVSESNAVG